MSVVLLSHTDAGAGASRAAHRIHKALLAQGMDSTMLVGDKRTTDPTVASVAGQGLWRWRARVCELIEAKSARMAARDASVFLSHARLAHFRPASDPRVRQAQALGLFWINGAFVAPEGLTGLDQPVVWRLSDAWPFTGGCHYPGDCEGFTRRCGQCPQLRHPSGDDLSGRLWRRKEAAWRNLDLTVVAPSRWMADMARRSSLFADRRVEVVPTGVDLDLFSPRDRQAARARLGIPQDRVVLAFGALDPGGDARKGFWELAKALEELAATFPGREKLLAVVFGSDSALPPLPVQAMSLGRVRDDETLALTYSSSDMVVVPSREDNLPNVALEAIACGAPVAGFATCGMPDIVVDGWNGLLTPTGKAQALGRAMAEALAGPIDFLTGLRRHARKHAESHFCAKTQALAYRDLYYELIDRASQRMSKPHNRPTRI